MSGAAPSGAPSISVCIPAYNAQRTIRRALDSVLTQDGYSPETVEIVVVEDCSTDRTREELEKLGARVGVQIVLNECNAGATGNWQRALGLGRGTIVTLLHCDDWYAPGCLRAVMEAFAAEPGLVLLACGQIHEHEDGRVEERNRDWVSGTWSTQAYLAELLELRAAPAPSMAFLRRDALEGIEPLFDPRFRWSPEVDLYVRMMAATPDGRVRHDGRALIRRGIGAEQQSSKYPGHSITDTCALLELHSDLYDHAALRRADEAARAHFTSCFLALLRLRDWRQLLEVLGNPAFRRWMRRSPANALGLLSRVGVRSARYLARAISNRSAR